MTPIATPSTPTLHLLGKATTLLGRKQCVQSQTEIDLRLSYLVTQSIHLDMFRKNLLARGFGGAPDLCQLIPNAAQLFTNRSCRCTAFLGQLSNLLFLLGTEL